MGKGAARKGLDLAGHSGLITGGSANVFVDGMPAARKGDGFICPATGHQGGGVIKGGSSTVFINGKSAARKGDPTMCGELPLPSVGVTPAPTIEKDLLLVNEKFSRDSYIKVLGGSGSFSDKDKDGFYDTVGINGAFLDAKYNSPDWEPFGKGNGGIGGGVRYSILHGEASMSDYGWKGEEMGYKATGIHHEVSGHIGKEGVLYGNVTGFADVGYIEEEVKAVLIVDEKENRYGFDVGAQTAQGVGRAGVEGDVDLLGIVKVKGKVAGKMDDVSAGTFISGYVDTDDYAINLSGTIKAGFLVGGEADVSVTLSAKPIVDFVACLITPKDGTILTGSSTVIIG